MSIKNLSRRDEREVGPRTEASQVTERRQSLIPAVDVLENKDGYLIVADMPGVRSGDVQIQYTHDELSIRAPRTAESFGEGESGKVTYEYARRFRVPTGIESDKITAEMKQGVLRLHLPKPETLKPRQIPVTLAK